MGGMRYKRIVIEPVVVRLLSGESLADVARDTGIPKTTIANWMRRYRNRNRIKDKIDIVDKRKD